MQAEILHLDDCPSWEEAGRRLRTALDSTGHRHSVITYTLVASPAAAATPAVSHHLKTLEAAGLVSKERRGMSVHYTVETDAIRALERAIHLG